MAAVTEINSLEEISYRSPSKLKALGVGIAALFLMGVGFLNFYPIGAQVRKLIRAQMQGGNCNVDFRDLSIKPLFMKMVISDLTLPASCFNRAGEPIKLTHVTVNYHLINFFPLGLPFRIDTELEAQPLSVHYVLGFGQHMLRIKDQKLALGKVMPLLAPALKMNGTITVDLNLRTNNQGAMTSMTLKAVSRDFELPAQNLSDFNVPNLKIGNLAIDAHSDAAPRIILDRLTAGTADAPVRAEFKGRMDYMPAGAAASPLQLTGEIALSAWMKETFPLLPTLLEAFPQKDGFYQVKIGGTLADPDFTP